MRKEEGGPSGNEEIHQVNPETAFKKEPVNVRLSAA
jgi:hypothetical protein